MSILYKLHNIVQRYGEHTALDMRHIPALEIKRGAVIALTGPNGVGKSTLLRILAFLEKPSAGTLSFYGNNPMHSRQDVTLLLQEPYLFKMSVLDNVCYGLKMRGKKDGMREKALEALQTVGFESEQVAQRPWYQLSGGEKQRVALAARLVLEPLALLLDEPTAHTDAACSKAIHAAVHKAANKGTTVIVSSHDKLWLESLKADYVELRAAGQ